MPKMIGWVPTEVQTQTGLEITDLGVDKDLLVWTREELAAAWTRIALGTLRAMARRGFTTSVSAVLSTSDKGGPGRLAKRWFQWFVPTGAYREYRAGNPLRRR